METLIKIEATDSNTAHFIKTVNGVVYIEFTKNGGTSHGL